jgi:Flp pilus assembly protein TadD
MAHLNLGLTLARRSELAEALPFLEKAVRLAPDSLDAHLALGQVLSARGQAARARPHLQRAAGSSDPKVRKAAADLLRE